MKPLALVAGLLLVAGASATVVQQTLLEALHGEVATAPTDIVLVPQGVAIDVLGTSAAGTTLETAVELALVPGLASPGVTAGNYAYTIEVREVHAAAIASGNYSAQLTLDGTPLGSVYFTQGTDLSLSIEAIQLTWDLGASLPAGSAVYEVSVSAL